jgi:hypothetical protein
MSITAKSSTVVLMKARVALMEGVQYVRTQVHIRVVDDVLLGYCLLGVV